MLIVVIKDLFNSNPSLKPVLFNVQGCEKVRNPEVEVNLANGHHHISALEKLSLLTIPSN